MLGFWEDLQAPPSSVEIDGGSTIRDGICSVTYSRAGTCQPYTVKLVDEHGDVLVVTVDTLAGAEIDKGI